MAMGRRIATISTAIVLALLGTMLVVVYVGRADARALSGVQTMQVLVAKAPLSKGQTVKAAQDVGLLMMEALPRKTVPPRAVATIEPSDTGLVFANDVTAGEIVLRSRLVPAAAIVPDGLQIPAGKLAVTVQLEDPARVASFVNVGSDIAVFDSYDVFEDTPGTSWTPSGDHVTDGPKRDKATRVLLPRARVLAIGTSFKPAVPSKSSSAASSQASTTTDKSLTLVTVAVDQTEAEKLIHGTQTGTLYLGLLGAYQVKPGPGVDNRTLFDR